MFGNLEGRKLKGEEKRENERVWFPLFGLLKIMEGKRKRVNVTQLVWLRSGKEMR